MVQRIYIDTSVVGGYFDEEFELYTKLFFNKVFDGTFKVMLSDILTTELEGAPDKVWNFYQSIPPKHTEVVEQSEESIQLAEQYLKEGGVGKTSRIDCRHIAH